VKDLPLLGNSMKVGFGLWKHVWLSLPLELATLIAGAIIYDRTTGTASRLGAWSLWGYVALMVLVQIYGQFGPDPASPTAEAQTALAAYIALAAIAGVVDWIRPPSATQPTVPASHNGLIRQSYSA
jgi:hypothetical protein